MIHAFSYYSFHSKLLLHVVAYLTLLFESTRSHGNYIAFMCIFFVYSSPLAGVLRRLRLIIFFIQLLLLMFKHLRLPGVATYFFSTSLSPLLMYINNFFLFVFHLKYFIGSWLILHLASMANTVNQTCRQRAL